jgi:hypothetical protein
MTDPTKPPTIEERLKTIERLARLNITVDPHRAYSDEQLCILLGDISRTTLWRLRKSGELKTIELWPGGPQSTTGQQVIDYLAGRERAAEPFNYTGTGRRRHAA